MKLSAKQIRTIENEAQQLLDFLEDCVSAPLRCRSGIADAAELYAGSEARELLDAIPVSELSRAYSGLRVKCLTDNGIRTLGDIARASRPKLAAINGISEEGSFLIKDLVTEIEKNNRAKIRIRLSTEKQTEEATELVLLVSRYRRLLPMLEEGERIFGTYGEGLSADLRNVRSARSTLKWMFTFGPEKHRTQDAASRLADFLASEEGRRASERKKAADRILNELTPEDAWIDFTGNSPAYFALLEELCPGLLGTEDLCYGLAPDVAASVIDESLDLTGLRCTLRKYQVMGVKFILHQGKVLLGDEMGLGKTIQAIASMVVLRNRGCTRFLVICPASVLPGWTRELRKHCDLPVHVLHGNRYSRELELWNKEGGAAVTSYDSCPALADSLCPYDLVVADEAHYIKNPYAKRTQNVRKICARAERILFMTGTPIENRVEDMVRIVEILRPDVAEELRSSGHVLTSFLFRVQAAEVYYRRKREDVLTELPDLVINDEWCEMCGPEREVYEDSVLSSHIQNVRRVSWNVPDIAYSSKAARLLEIISQAREEGRKVLVFSFFLDTLQIIRRLLGPECTEAITGRVSPERRQQILSEFEHMPAGTVLPAQITSGGTGLNIQAASVVILCEPQFKPSTENQAISRAYRMGQTRTVHVHRLLCEDSIDERICSLLEEKQEIFDRYADRSVAADTAEISDKLFSGLLDQERKRILERTGGEHP